MTSISQLFNITADSFNSMGSWLKEHNGIISLNKKNINIIKDFNEKSQLVLLNNYDTFIEYENENNSSNPERRRSESTR